MAVTLLSLKSINIVYRDEIISQPVATSSQLGWFSCYCQVPSADI